MLQLQEAVPSSELGDERPHSPLASSSSAYNPPANNPSLDDESVSATPVDLERASSVERSMERTVNLSTEGLGFVSLSPVEERDVAVTVDDPQPHPNGSYVTYAVTTKVLRTTVKDAIVFQ